MRGVERRSLRARVASSIGAGGVGHISTAAPSSSHGTKGSIEGEEAEPPTPAVPWKRSRGDATRQDARALGQQPSSSPKTHIGTDIKPDVAPLTAELSRPAGDLAIKTPSWQSLEPNPVRDVGLFLPSNDPGRSSLAAYSFYLPPSVVVLCGRLLRRMGSDIRLPSRPDLRRAPNGHHPDECVTVGLRCR